MSSPIDLKRMRYIVEVAKAEAITSASENLGITQSALSRSIAEVEETLGVKLFHRRPRGIELSEQGERFVAQAEQILGNVDDLISGIQRQTLLLITAHRCSIGSSKQPGPGRIEHHGETVGVVEQLARPVRNGDRHQRNETKVPHVLQCQDPDLNWGHGDFQSPALPTELSRHVALAT